ncbi:hypothetical protein QJS04_geneDACA013996 [Acorus gramineus]|uniref:Uncharacterized protein n=1 Tax=Acorus gramineus TaxID=55184 RepID=A0AAV9AYX7_ACOGR|nr:hypothetical protein QJS04_geneDACA013996 [Acorus gramineus]
MSALILPFQIPPESEIRASLHEVPPRYPALPSRIHLTTSELTPSPRFVVAPSRPRDASILRRRRPPPASASAEEHGRSPVSEEAEAREAVADLLLELGASADDSTEIAANSPVYVRSLIDGVRELDELPLWEWKAGDLSFKEKVYHMAMEKGDGGVLPFLESLGLSRVSSMNVARHLSSETLPSLINKVRFVKELLYPANNREMFIGKNSRRMMMHLTISSDDAIQQTLSFFEKMEARRGGLSMLGSKDASFPCLVESFPRLLQCSVELHWKPLASFFELVGIPKGHVGEILLQFPPVIFYDTEKDIKPRLSALRKVGIEEEDVSVVLLKYPWILSTCIQDNSEDIITFFDTEKVPKVSVHTAIKSWPHILGCSTDRMKSMIEQFGELGVKNKKLGRVIASSPQLLLKKPVEFMEVVLFMEELGLDKGTVGRILCRCPEIFAASIENTLQEKVKFLMDLGITRDHLPRIIRKYPEFLVCDSNITLPSRMTYLRKLGLSKKKLRSMVFRFSPLLGYSIDKVIQPKLKFLLYTMKQPLAKVVEYPRYFSYSLEKRIKPRYWVLKGRDIQCSLEDMLGKNDEKFAEEYMGIGRMLILPPQVPDGNDKR